MANLIPYVVFSGNCKEAMEFYANVLNGEITSMTTFGKSPIDVPTELENRVFDSELRAGNVRFKASDDLPGHSVKQGNNISLFVSFSDKKLKETIFKSLSNKGDILFPLDDNFGMLKDKFGLQWMFVNESEA